MSVPIQPLGDAAMLAHGTPAVAGAVPAGVTDVVPAFGQVGVYFDPTQTTFERVASWVSGRLLVGDAASVASSRVVEIPTVYDAHFGPDLEHVANSAGLSIDEVVKRHSGRAYTVGAVGFQPGFPYLVGLPGELQTPRRSSPRTQVPAGSVGIGGPYTGVYPAESPGGWNLIGRTPLRLFDEGREPPSLVAPGDRVRVMPIDKAEFDRLAAENQPKPRVASESESPILKVVSAGALTTTQSLGRPGWRHVGVTPGGAMDPASLRLANLLVENDPDVPAIEATLTGPVLECLASTAVGIAGAVPVARRVHLSKGDRLDLRRLVGGARAYVALPGGVDAPLGRPHQERQTIGSLDTRAATRLMRKPTPEWAMAGVGWKRTLAGGAATLRVLRGPQAERFDDEAWRTFLEAEYRVSPKSSRMGVRLEGPKLAAEADDLPSQPVCCGAIQVPPGGQPIVLGADGQTLGGYPVIAVVASADWPVLGQLAPGDAVRFVEIDLEEAARLRHAAERALAISAVGISYRAKDS